MPRPTRLATLCLLALAACAGRREDMRTDDPFADKSAAAATAPDVPPEAMPRRVEAPPVPPAAHPERWARLRDLVAEGKLDELLAAGVGLRVEPPSDPGDLHEAAAALASGGQRAVKVPDTVMAADLFKLALALTPSDAALARDAAEAMYAAADPQSAKLLARTGLRVAPLDPGLLAVAIRSARDLKEWVAAHDLLERLRTSPAGHEKAWLAIVNELSPEIEKNARPSLARLGAVPRATSARNDGRAGRAAGGDGARDGATPRARDTGTDGDTSAAGPTRRHDIALYSTSWCGYCKKARRFLTCAGARFADLDVERDADAAREFQRLGGRGVPLVTVNGRRFFGFDRNGIAEALGDGETESYRARLSSCP